MIYNIEVNGDKYICNIYIDIQMIVTSFPQVEALISFHSHFSHRHGVFLYLLHTTITPSYIAYPYYLSLLTSLTTSHFIFLLSLYSHSRNLTRETQNIKAGRQKSLKCRRLLNIFLCC